MFAHHESVLCYSSTEHCERLGPSTWRTTVGGNSLFAHKGTRLTPIQIYIPNVFPNIAVDTTLELSTGVDPLATLPRGQYSAAEIIAFYNASDTFTSRTLVMAQNAQGYFTITNNSIGANTFNFNAETAKYLGSPTTVGVVINTTETLTFPNLPNLGGEKVVFIQCNRLGNLNMYSTIGLKDVVFPISLVDTVYGDMAVYSPGDHVLGDVDFQSEVNITNLDFELLDSNLQPLPFDDNQHIRMIWKLHHNEGDSGKTGSIR